MSPLPFAPRAANTATIRPSPDHSATPPPSRRTFFRYFESKRDLIAQPIESYGASLTKAIEACPAGLSAATPFRHVVLEVAQRTVSNSRMRKVMAIAAKHPAAREAQLSRVWFTKGKKDLASAAQQVFSELAKAICEE